MTGKIFYMFLLCLMFVFPQKETAYSSELDSEIYGMIESLYAGEVNDTYRKIATEVLKDSIWQEDDGYISVGIVACEVPYSEDILYYLHGIGLTNSWPRYSSDGKTIKIYVEDVNGTKCEEYKKDIVEIYNFIQTIKLNTLNMTDVNKINYFHSVINGMLVYDNSNEITYKINEVLEKKEAVCTGYSSLFYLCCINTGIQCENVGNPQHMWNRVYLDNNWEYIDLTWNDMLGENKWYLLDICELDNDHVMLDFFYNEPTTQKTQITVVNSSP